MIVRMSLTCASCEMWAIDYFLPLMNKKRMHALSGYGRMFIVNVTLVSVFIGNVTTRAARYWKKTHIAMFCFSAIYIAI